MYNLVFGSNEGESRYIGVKQEKNIYDTFRAEMPQIPVNFDVY